ncbi:hypothetical protein GL50803_00137753 [Giardia duodenalis]|uniref:Uncharacterized protein n=1 Tax=Giardia intestinalis (strain ATCC 50803 / WB clone C6) TaxID=184922 RepID=A8BYT7_GIAIC|nr:hypothetical protein GL50803_00137753 [Giardia intestinalis]KAE8302660.1 hypothetical protein GL50803_00137753 [Giardia intestinalis]|eukprot:XP_001704133.1 Hypothetical protein GL50803_137753 [Giardia lamblia ATCC 50803]
MFQGELETKLPGTGGAGGALAFANEATKPILQDAPQQISITKERSQKPRDNVKSTQFTLSPQNKSDCTWSFTTEAAQDPTQDPPPGSQKVRESFQGARHMQGMPQGSQQNVSLFSSAPQDNLSFPNSALPMISMEIGGNSELINESTPNQDVTAPQAAMEPDQQQAIKDMDAQLPDAAEQETQPGINSSQSDNVASQSAHQPIDAPLKTNVIENVAPLPEKGPELPDPPATPSENKPSDNKPGKEGHKSKETSGGWVDNKPNRKNRYHKKETEAVRPSVPAPPQQSSLVQSQKPLPETAAPKDEEAPAALPERTAEIFPAVSVETLAPQAEPEPEPESSTAAHDSKPPVYNARKHHEEKAKIVDYKKLTSPGERRAPQSDFMTHLLSLLESRKELSSFQCRASGIELNYKDVLVRLDSAVADPVVHNTRKQLSTAMLHYFDVARAADIEKYLTNERAGDMPQIVKLMIKGDETNFERTTLLSIRDKLNKITKETVKQVHADVVKMIQEIPNLENQYQKIFLFKAIFDEIIDKACMEPNFVDVYTDLLFALLDNPRGRTVQGDKDTPAGKDGELSIATGFLEVLRIFADLKDDTMFPDMRGFREMVQKNKDKLGDDKPLRGFTVGFFRDYMLRGNMAEEIKTGQTHNPVFNVEDTDTDEVRSIKEQNKLVHLSNNVKFLASIFTKDLLDFYRKERRQQKRMSEKTGSSSASITKKTPTNMLLPIAQFVTLISFLLRRQFDKTIDNYYTQTKNKGSSDDISRAKEEMRRGFPDRGSITIDDVDRKTSAYKSTIARLQALTEPQYKTAWSSEYMDLVIIILRTGGLAMDNYDHSTYEYTLYVYCMDVLQLLLEKQVVEVRIQVLLTEILEDRSGGWKSMQKTLNYEAGPVKPSRPEREPDDDTPAAVRENGLRYTIAFNLGFLNANISNKEVDLFSDGMMEKWCRQVKLTARRMVFDGSIKIMYDELPNLFPSRSEGEIVDLYRAFASGLVSAYSTTTKDNQQTNKDVVSTLASLFISDKIRFPCLFPSATRVDPSDPRRGYEGSIEPKEYQLAVEVMQHCIERAIQGTIADNEFDFSESEMALLRAEYTVENNYKPEKASNRREKVNVMLTSTRKTPSKAVLDLLKQRKCGLFGEPDIEGHEEEAVDFLEQSALDTVAEIIFRTKYPMIKYENIATGCMLYDKLLGLAKGGKPVVREFHTQTSMPHLEKFLVHDLQLPTSICFLVCDEISRDPSFMQKSMSKPSNENPLLIGKMGHILLDRLFADFCERLDKANKTSPLTLAESLAAQPVLRVRRVIIESMKNALKKAADQNKAMKLMIAAVVSKDLMKLEDFKEMVKADKAKRYGKTFAGLEEASQWVETADESAVTKVLQPNIELKSTTKEMNSDKVPKEGTSGFERPQHHRGSDYHNKRDRQATGDRFNRSSFDRGSGHGNGRHHNNNNNNSNNNSKYGGPK